MIDAAKVLCVDDARRACRGEVDLTARLRKAFAAARGFFMGGAEAHLFHCGCAAAMLESPLDDIHRIQRTYRALRSIGAAMQGVPVDMAQVLDDAEEYLPLLGLWAESAR